MCKGLDEMTFWLPLCPCFSLSYHLYLCWRFTERLKKRKNLNTVTNNGFIQSRQCSHKWIIRVVLCEHAILGCCIPNTQQDYCRTQQMGCQHSPDSKPGQWSPAFSKQSLFMCKYKLHLIDLPFRDIKRQKHCCFFALWYIWLWTTWHD